MTIIVIDNYFKEEKTRINKIVDALREARKSKILIWKYSEIKEKEKPDDLEAIILSGSSAHLQNPGDKSKYETEIEFIRHACVPILGICFGHQLIGVAFGSKVYTALDEIKGFNSIEILQPNEIFSSWRKGDVLSVSQHHKDSLSELPEGFIWLATSQSCRIEAMRHHTEPIYGIQAHIERAEKEKPDGYQIIRNFIEKVVERHIISRIVNTKSFNEIKQGIIDSVRDIEYDVVKEDYRTVESKLKESQMYVEAWILKKTINALN